MRQWKVYPKYKDSGVEWLGEIPEEWEIWKISHLFKTIGSGTTPKSDDLSYYDGDIPWVNTSELRESLILDTNTKITPKALQDYPILRFYPAGSLLFAMYGATIGRLGILGVRATVNQACCVFADSDLLDTKFFYYWLLMRKPVLIALSSGGGQPNLNQEKLREIRIPTPNLPDQTAIAAFLDRETARIDALIEKKKRQIELLQEKRAALISQAVTKGLDPTVPMKDSGVPWLGEVPEHWEVFRFKHVASINTGQIDPETVEFRDTILIAPNHIESVTGRLLYTETASEQAAESGKYPFTEKQVLYSKIRPHLQKACYPKISGICSADIYPLTPNMYVTPEYLLYILISPFFTDYCTKESMRVAMPKINRDALNDCVIILPSVEEQNEIIKSLEEKIIQIDEIIGKITCSLEIIREYRSALISAAVTGKIDVREEVTA